MKNKTFIKIRGLLADMTTINENEIQSTSLLEKDLGADSLDKLEIILIIETEWNISIPDTFIPNTVNDLVEYIENLQKTKF